MRQHVSLSTRTEHLGTLYFVALLREELGLRIKVARKAAGLTQQALAAAIGLKHAQDISRYERGKTAVPDFRIDLIAEVTKRPRSYFLRDPSEAEPLANGAEDLADLRRELEVEIGRLRHANDQLEERLAELGPPQQEREQPGP